MAKPKLALIPSGVADNQVFSVLPSNGDGDFNFTRGTVATRVNAQGLIETVSNDLPRLNYPLLDGVVQECPSLLLENSATNLITYSEDFSNTVWNNSNEVIRTANATISPDGSLNAFDIKPTNINANHTLRAQNLGGFTSGAVVNVSFFAKQNGYKYISIVGGFGSSNTPSVIFNLEDGLIQSGTGTIENYENGWYRCIVPITLNSTALYCVGTILNDNLLGSFIGDNVKGIYVYGFQVEQGNLSSYIPTNGSATTRLAETCNGAGTSDTFNDSEGVLMAEISALVNNSDTKRISLSDGTSSNRISLYLSNETIGGVIVSGGSVGFSTSVSGYDATLNNKILFKYKENDFSIFVNGFEILTDTSGATPIGLNELRFDNGYSGNDFYGKTKQIQYYDSALTDSELEQLTSWVSFQEMAQSQLYTIQ